MSEKRRMNVVLALLAYCYAVLFVPVQIESISHASHIMVQTTVQRV